LGYLRDPGPGAPAERARASMSRPDLVVVGGGLAGITAALAAADAGAQVVLLEKRPHLGGAASSFFRAGHWQDHGQHVILRCCTAYRSLIERIGGAGHLYLQERLEIPVVARGEETEVLYWIGCAGPEQDAGDGTDFFAIRNQYVSVTPLQIDLTRHASIQGISAWLRGEA